MTDPWDSHGCSSFKPSENGDSVRESWGLGPVPFPQGGNSGHEHLTVTNPAATLKFRRPVTLGQSGRSPRTNQPMFPARSSR